MQVRWSVTARLELRHRLRYIATENPAAARLIATRIRHAVDGLASYPLKGRPGKVVDTRELLIAGTPFIAAYRVHGEVVEIVAFLHQAKQWPESID